MVEYVSYNQENVNVKRYIRHIDMLRRNESRYHKTPTTLILQVLLVSRNVKWHLIFFSKPQLAGHKTPRYFLNV